MTSRRDFLRVAAMAAIAPLASSSSSSAATPGGFIDAHVHVWTPNVEKYPLGPGFTKEKMAPASFTPEELWAHARPNGVGRIVLIQMSFYKFDNSYMLETIAKTPDLFRGVAVIDESQSDLKGAMQKLAAQGVRGFRLYADRKNAESWIDSPAMRSLWTLGADLNLKMCLLSNPDALPAIARMCEKFPQTPVVIDHFSRIGMTGQIVQSDLDNLCRLSGHEQLWIKTSAFYALGAKQPPYADLAPMIQKLRDVYGASRLMWASDCPFQVEKGNTYEASIALIRDKLDFLTPEDKAWLLRKTAEKVFFA